jgi:hypothetical protein
MMIEQDERKPSTSVINESYTELDCISIFVSFVRK